MAWSDAARAAALAARRRKAKARTAADKRYTKNMNAWASATYIKHPAKRKTALRKALRKFYP